MQVEAGRHRLRLLLYFLEIAKITAVAPVFAQLR